MEPQNYLQYTSMLDYWTMVSLCRTSCCLLGKGPSELRGFCQAICIVEATHKNPRIFCTVYGMVWGYAARIGYTVIL
jgi:hypothetical protein